MPMRDELFIPKGHQLYKARSSTEAWHRFLDDADVNVIAVFSLVGLFTALYLATHCPLPEQILLELMTTSQRHRRAIVSRPAFWDA
jgi:hypothetical protein